VIWGVDTKQEFGTFQTREEAPKALEKYPRRPALHAGRFALGTTTLAPALGYRTHASAS
jgi:hypothetical protein